MGHGRCMVGGGCSVILLKDIASRERFAADMCCVLDL